MKRTKSKSIYMMAITLLLVFLCVVSSTYSYFSVHNTRGRTVTEGMSNFAVLMYCDTSVGATGQTIYPIANASITRGGVVKVTSTSGGTTAQMVRFASAGYSDVPAYIRFWLDAYLVVDGEEVTTTNYGKYFSLYNVGLNDDNVEVANEVIFTNDKVDYKTDENGDIVAYYLVDPMDKDDTAFDVFNALMISYEIPDVLLQGEIVIRFSFEAVQATHGAFLDEFNDSKGYCSSWR